MIADGTEFVTTQARLIGQSRPVCFGVGLVGGERRHTPGAGRQRDQRNDEADEKRSFGHHGNPLSVAKLKHTYLVIICHDHRIRQRHYE
jgi:hypothetical protein